MSADDTSGARITLPQPEEIPEREREDAMAAYLMMFASLAIGLPIPLFNLIASVIYFLVNRKTSPFVAFHSLQALLTHVPVVLANAGLVGWFIAILATRAGFAGGFFWYFFFRRSPQRPLHRVVDNRAHPRAQGTILLHSLFRAARLRAVLRPWSAGSPEADRVGEQASGGVLTARARLAREAVVVLAAVALLAAVAFSVQRFFFSRPVFSPDIPRSLDDALRPVMLRQIRAGGTELADPAVIGAFAVIADRLRPAFLRLSPGAPLVTIIVVDSPVINAFTLPGGVVCVCSGLARTLVSGEEMAAILGHEFSHVANRDPLVLLARRIGISALADIVTAGQGGTISQGIMQELVNARYTRKAEDRADHFAVDLLSAAGLPPASFAAALERIRDAAPKNPKLLQYFDPHTPVEQRILMAGERAKGGAARARALDVDWSAVIAALSAEKGGSD